ncbi:MocR-like pyridoxine biosynthesis transcription factor PdxR [Tenggerimyces flavus]|uniref:PLP-dependent aminotransferase family protein n=1 Tax=Tenggerimyces flavus TaxID=1708749 RepID=A0ABV7Y9J8_9ACTN|nr:PLP-dependent aminotransferase family protein [Tenggerimyces flavus]MBM7783789.1 GntR family transcriptional regulator/MocR family aminotransferase [Tenggerimyces flavus]
MPRTDLDLHLDVRRGPRVGRALEQALRDAIRDGRLQPGTRLPGTRSLAAELGVARGTVVEAFAQLIAEGWLVGLPGSGTKVASSTAPALVERAAPALIDLRPGRPDLSSFPRSAWSASVRRVLATATPESLDVPDPAGLPELRHVIASYLARTRGVRATADTVLVTAGFAHGLAVLAHTFRRLGLDKAATESPCLSMHRQLLASAGLDLVSMHVDEQGADPAGLADGTRVALLTPSHQHPLGAALSPSRRTAFLDWAKAQQGYVVEDDYDGEFRYDGQLLGAFQAADPDRVIYAGSASKALAPGMRMGWLVLPPRLRQLALDVASDLGASVSAIDQLALADFVERGDYDRQVRRARRAYQRRRTELAERIEAPLIGIDAGLQAVVELESAEAERALVKVAAKAGLRMHGLNSATHWIAPNTHAAALLIGYATPPAHSWRQALDLLSDLIPKP